MPQTDGIIAWWKGSSDARNSGVWVQFLMCPMAGHSEHARLESREFPRAAPYNTTVPGRTYRRVYTLVGILQEKKRAELA